MAGTIIQDHVYRAWRAEMKAHWAAVNAPCGICGQQTIDYVGPHGESDSFEMDHIVSRKKRPDLAMTASNVQPSHFRCNHSKSYGDARPGLGAQSEPW